MGKNTKQLREKLKRKRESYNFAIKQRVTAFRIGKSLFPKKSLHDLILMDPRYRASKKLRSARKPLSPKQKAALRKAQSAAAKANRKRRYG